MNFLIFSTADWDNPFWTNKQHVAVSLADLGHKVVYVESLGLRRPTASKQDLKRIFFRLKKLFSTPRKVSENIYVISPIIIPEGESRIFHSINRFVLKFYLWFWCTVINFKPDILWTYNPLSTYYFSLKKYPMVVYHCVDEVSEQPGMPAEKIKINEIELIKSSDYVFVTSRELLKSRSCYNDQVHYFSNVVDYNHFSKSPDYSDKDIPSDLRNLGSPVVGFIGAISSYKLDLNLIYNVAKANSSFSFVFIGKVGEGDPWTDISFLDELNNVFFLGPKDYLDLPKYLKGIDVAILPNNINNYTDNMFPMKFYEYLASRTPVVSVNLKSLEEHEDYFFAAVDHDSFSESIQSAFNATDDFLSKGAALASKNTYKSRTIKMLDILMKNDRF